MLQQKTVTKIAMLATVTMVMAGIEESAKLPQVPQSLLQQGSLDGIAPYPAEIPPNLSVCRVSFRFFNLLAFNET